MTQTNYRLHQKPHSKEKDDICNSKTSTFPEASSARYEHPECFYAAHSAIAISNSTYEATHAGIVHWS
jgi:hypothetical protein